MSVEKQKDDANGEKRTVETENTAVRNEIRSVSRDSFFNEFGPDFAEIEMMSAQLQNMLNILGISKGHKFDALCTWNQAQFRSDDDLWKLPPDNTNAMKFLVSDVIRKAGSSITEYDGIKPDYTKNLLSVGSPTSDLFSRKFMGFMPDAEDDTYMMLCRCPVALPYIFKLDRESVGKTTITRLVQDKQMEVSRPNWFIDDGKEQYVPQHNDEGRLVDDYLLITSLPNYMHPNGDFENSRILNFGGTHGVATRAVRQIFSLESENYNIGRGIWREIGEKVNAIKPGVLEHSGVQILIRVGVKKENAFTDIIEKAVVVGVKIFGDSQTFREAHRIVSGWK